MGWPDLCERLMTRLETSGADTTAERGEFAVLVAECGSSGWCADVPRRNACGLRTAQHCRAGTGSIYRV